MDMGVDTKQIEVIDNDTDKMIFALFSTGCERVVIRGNYANTYAGNIADNLGSGNMVGRLISDTTALRIYAKNYGTTNAGYTASAWNAASSSAYGTEVVPRLKLAKGLYLIVVALPIANGAIPVRLRNYTASQDFGPVFTVATNVYNSGTAAIVTAVDDSEIGLATQGSTSVTFTNTGNAGITAIPIKF